MITRIEIDGFKSFRNFHLDLEPFQVIVGLNAAGKSNLLDAIRFLTRIVTADLPTAYEEMWAATGELFTVLPDGKTADRISFALEFLLHTGETDADQSSENSYVRLRYELAVGRAADEQEPELSIQHERLVGISKADDQWAKSRSLSGRETRLWDLGKGLVVFPRTLTAYFGESKDPISVVIDATDTQPALGHAHGLDILSKYLYRELQSLSFLQIEPEAARAATSLRGPSKLDGSGKFLANMLARMAKQDRLLLADVGTDLSNLVTGLIRVEVEEDQAHGHNVVWVYTPEGKRFSLRELSDGTLRLLVLAALRNDPQQAGTLLLEEPENGVHPFRIKQIAGLLRAMATDFSQPPEPGERLRQMIVTTHSPILVSQLEDHEIVFAHTVDVQPEGQAKPMRVTRMSSLKQAESPAHEAFTRREILRYLERKDLEHRSNRLRGGAP